MRRFYLVFRLVLLAALIANKSGLAFSQAPTLSIPTQGAAAIEGGAFCFFVQIANPTASATSVDIVADAGTTASPGSDFLIDPVTIVFPAGFSGNMTCCISTLDDAAYEPVEYVHLKLANATNNAMIANGTISFTFYDNDSISTTFPCQQPFISEYVHSLIGGESQALEIFNPAAVPVNLAGYSVKIFHNGAPDPTVSIPLTGVLMPKEVFVLANPASNPGLTGAADLLTAMLNYSGNDATGLFQGDVPVDVIGVIGQDPGLYWPAGYQQTASSVLVRDSVVRQGEASWYLSAGHWRSYTQSDFTHLGAHFMLPCGPAGEFPPLLSIVTTDAVFDEGIGGLSILAALYYPKDVATSVDISVGAASTALPGLDFSLSQTSITFPANFSGTMGIGMSIADDLLTETSETLVIRLSNPSNGAVLLDSVWVLTILDNDPSATNAPGADAGIRVSPNPARPGSILSVKIPGGEACEMCLQHMAGNWSQRFSTVDNQGDPSNWKINIPPGLPAGLYVLSLKTEAGIIVRKVAIE